MSNQLSYECAAEAGAAPVTLQIAMSRLSPAVVLQANSSSVDLLVGLGAADMPGHLAIANLQRIEHRTTFADPLPTDVKWVLLWRGRSTPMLGDDDMPLLIVPFAPLKQLEALEGGGLRLKFEGERAVAAVIPIYGMIRPLARDTAEWTTQRTLPGIAVTCGWWQANVAAFPIDATESFDYDAEEDAVDVKYTYDYLQLKDRPPLSAPVPPMLALAVREGFGKAGGALEFKFLGTPENPSLATIFGPYLSLNAADSLTFTVKGLKRYVEYQRPAPKPSNANSKPFEDKLQAEVQKIMAAGVLAPWFYQDGPVSREPDPTTTLLG